MKLFQGTAPKIVAVGRNYASHAKEMGAVTLPEAPILFLKPPSSYLSAPGAIRIPAGVQAHHEVELGVIIGRQGSDIAVEHARSYIHGIACCIDVTARNLQSQAKKEGSPWSVSKGYDTFCPVSRFVPIAEVEDPNDIPIYLKVNGEVRQQDTTKSMIHSTEQLVSYISTVMTLVPGDLILTGTPAGVGEMRPGDQVEAGLGDLVTMTVTCEARPPPPEAASK